jgi:hypothetical protein
MAMQDLQFAEILLIPHKNSNAFAIPNRAVEENIKLQP